MIIILELEHSILECYVLEDGTSLPFGLGWLDSISIQSSFKCKYIIVID